MGGLLSSREPRRWLTLDGAFEGMEVGEHEPAMRGGSPQVLLTLGGERNLDLGTRCAMGELGLLRRCDLDPCGIAREELKLRPTRENSGRQKI